jgi:hypothetical protein
MTRTAPVPDVIRALADYQRRWQALPADLRAQLVHEQVTLRARKLA